MRALERLSGSLVGLVELDLDARARSGLGDAGAHEARADDADPGDVSHGRDPSARGSPRRAGLPVPLPAGARARPCGGARRSSTRSIRARSPTPAATASATSRACARASSTCAGSGVDAVWLSPIYRSPMADFGYDVADYCDVDPVFGDLAASTRCVADAHALGLKVLLDWVPNHTSDQHPWFRESRAARDAPKRDWYRWRDGAPGRPPNNWPAAFGGGPGVDVGRRDRAVVPPPVPARAARPQLGQARGRRGDARRPALLARPRHRRLPRRRRAPDRQGPGAARRSAEHARQLTTARCTTAGHARAAARHPRACSTPTRASA